MAGTPDSDANKVGQSCQPVFTNPLHSLSPVSVRDRCNWLHRSRQPLTNYRSGYAPVVLIGFGSHEVVIYLKHELYKRGCKIILWNILHANILPTGLEPLHTLKLELLIYSLAQHVLSEEGYIRTFLWTDKLTTYSVIFMRVKCTIEWLAVVSIRCWVNRPYSLLPIIRWTAF